MWNNESRDKRVREKKYNFCTTNENMTKLFFFLKIDINSKATWEYIK